MQKSISIYCHDAVISAVLRDASAAVGDTLSIDLDVRDGGAADIVLCAPPYDHEAVSRYAAEHKMSFLLYWGEADGSNEDIFDYKFRPPLRIGCLMDRLSSLLLGKSSGQVKRILEIKNWYIQFPENILRSEGQDSVIQLTDRECQILRALYLSPVQGITRQDLLDSVWGYHKDVETHTLETHIYRLRQKLEKDPSRPDVLITADAGYVLRRS